MALTDPQSRPSSAGENGAGWRLTVLGNPATKKTSNRVFRRSGRIIVAPSAVHARWLRMALAQLKTQWKRPPLQIPVSIAAIFYRADRRRVDLVNAMQALADALQAAGVVANDRLIASWDGSRLNRDPARPRIELQIAVLPST